MKKEKEIEREDWAGNRQQSVRHMQKKTESGRGLREWWGYKGRRSGGMRDSGGSIGAEPPTTFSCIRTTVRFESHSVRLALFFPCHR